MVRKITSSQVSALLFPSYTAEAEDMRGQSCWGECLWRRTEGWVPLQQGMPVPTGGEQEMSKPMRVFVSISLSQAESVCQGARSQML